MALLNKVNTLFLQRFKGDVTLAKNVLISVFLHALEYYNKLLFIMTNYPSALNKAFKLRIYLKLYYLKLIKL